jgi:hypothetical protein
MCLIAFQKIIILLRPIVKSPSPCLLLSFGRLTDMSPSSCGRSEMTEQALKFMQNLPPGTPQRLALYGDFVASIENEIRKKFPNGKTIQPLLHQIQAAILDPPSKLVKSKNPVDLDTLIHYLQDACTLLPPDNPHRIPFLDNLGFSLWTRYLLIDSDADLDEAIERYQEALEARHAGDQQQSTSLGGLGCALVSRYQRSGADDADLQLAIKYHRKGLESRSEGHPDRDISLNNLGAALWLRFKLTSDQMDLEEAILHHREALTLRPEGDENRSSSLCNLAAGLLERYNETGQLDDLNTAIKLYEEACTEDDAASLDNLAVSLRTRFRREGNADDIERALGLQLKALPLRPFNHRDRGDSLSNMGLTLHDGFELTNDIDSLNSAISYHLEALEYRPVGSWDRPSTLNDLGHALHARYQAQCNLSDLEEAISHHREALQLTSSAPSDSRRRHSLTNLGAALLTFCQDFRQEDLLTEANRLLLDGLSEYPGRQVDRFICANALACSFWLHYNHFGVADSLEKSIINHRVALGCASKAKDRAISLSNYGISLLARFKRDGNPVDLNEAITSHRDALRLCPVQGSMHSAPSRQLAVALETRFLDSGNIGDLEEATLLHRNSVFHEPSESIARHLALSNLGNNLLLLYEQNGDLQALEEAIKIHTEVLANLKPTHAGYATALGRRGASLRSRYEEFGDLQDLAEAIELRTQALQFESSDLSRAIILNDIGNIYWLRYERLGNPLDIYASVSHFRDAVALSKTSPRYVDLYHTNLAVALHCQFELENKRALLDEALGYLDKIQYVPNSKETRHAHHHHILGSIYQSYHQTYGEKECLMKAIAHLEEASVLPATYEDEFKIYNNLGIVLKDRYEIRGDMSDLERAIECHRKAAALISSRKYKLPPTLMSLANTILTRFEHLGREDDLQEALACHRGVLESISEDDALRYKCLNNFGITLLLRFKRYRKRKDLEDSISSYRRALLLLGPLHPDQSMCLDNLGCALQTLFEETKDETYLIEAIHHRRKALYYCPPGHVNHYTSLYSVGHVLLSLFDIKGEMSILDEAVEHLTKAKEETSDDHPVRTIINAGLAACFLIRGELDTSFDQNLAFALFEEATIHRTSTSKSRFDVTLQWIKAAEKYKHPSVLLAYSFTLSLLQQSLLVNPTIETQRDFLIHLPKSLACDACACAIESGNIEKAVELLELGRVILWNRMRGYRHTMDGLRKSHPFLVSKFESLSASLERLATSSETGQILASPHQRSSEVKYSSPFELKMSNQRLLLQEWDEVVTKIRMLPEHDDFLKPIPFDVLQSASAEGPVVIVNLSERRCDAIILVQDQSPVLVPLQSTSVDAVEVMNVDLQESLVLSREKLEIDAAALEIPLRKLWNMRLNKIQSVLRNLWKHVGYPIHQRLLGFNVKEMSRIWWYPTGQLCALPVHAAGPYHVKMKNIPDLYISSYTPTLSSLISARAVEDLATTPSFLAIGVPDNTLRSAEEEITKIRDYIPNVKVMIGAQVTRDPLLIALRQHSWAHVACHGHWNARQPFQSSFELFDKESISVLELAKERLTHAEFAFLSACFAATPDLEGAPDEVIHLASALQFSGFRSVVGTLWELIDKDAPQLASDFYQDLVQEGKDRLNFKDTARALSSAVNRMREKPNMTPNRWIQIIHIGG